MHNRLTRSGGDHFGDQVAMASNVVAFEAQQARGPFAGKLSRLCQFGLRTIRCHVFAEDDRHAFGMTGANGIPARFGSTERLKVDVPESDYAKLATLEACVEYLATRLG